MAKLDPAQNRYFPSPQKVGNLHDDFRLLFQHVYTLQDRLAEMQGKLDTAHGTIAQMKTDHASQIARLMEPANSKMLGLRVRPTVLADGQKLTYVAAKGDFEFL